MKNNRLSKRMSRMTGLLLASILFIACAPFSMVGAAVLGLGTMVMHTPEIMKHVPMPSMSFGENAPPVVLTEEQKEAAFLLKIKAGVGEKFDQLIKSDVEFTALKALAEEMKTAKTKEELEGLKAAMDTMGLQIKAMNDAGKGANAKPKSLADGLVDAYKEMVLKGEIYHKEGGSDGEVKVSLAKGAFASRTINTKSAGTITEGNVTPSVTNAIPFTLSEYLSGYVGITRRNPFLVQICNLMRTSKRYVNWVEIQNPDGGAGTTAEGSAKTQQDFDIVEKSAKVEKITSYVKVSKESLDDIPYMDSLIRSQLIELCILKLDTQVLSGDGSTPNLNGIVTALGGVNFVGTPFVNGIDYANRFDVLRVAINQIYRASGGDSNYAANFVPNYIVLNPDDVAAMELTKNTQGNYLLPPFLSENGNMIGGCQIIANSGITSGKFLVGDFTKMMVAMREDATISVGLENADFTLNLVTILCELRAVTWIPSNYLNAFVYGTFSTAISYLKDAKS